MDEYNDFYDCHDCLQINPSIEQQNSTVSPFEGGVNSISKDLATYINNEGNLTLDERHCEEHVKACRECDVSKQLSATDKLALETLDNNLDTVSESDGTVSFTTLYAFK